MKRYLIILLFMPLLMLAYKNGEVLTAKPLYGYDFKQEHHTFGMEFGYWNERLKIIESLHQFVSNIGFDLGTTADTGEHLSLYGEIQINFMVVGLSAGPFLEWDISQDFSAGGQLTVWGVFTLLVGYGRMKYYFPSEKIGLELGVMVAFPIFTDHIRL